MSELSLQDLQSQLNSLQKEVGSLRTEVTRLNDIQAIRTLHFKYGYYWDNVLYDQVIDLFTDDVKLYYRGGLYHGKEGARRIYQGLNKQNGPPHGFMINHHQVQDVVTISPSGTTANGRFHMLMFGGVHTEAINDNPPRYSQLPRQWIEQGMYENEYRKEDGVWKCCVFRYKEIWTAPFELSAGGWAEVKRGILPYEELMKTREEGNKLGPDEKVPENAWIWPERRVFPYHYPHPVTGEWLQEKDVKPAKDDRKL